MDSRPIGSLLDIFDKEWLVVLIGRRIHRECVLGDESLEIHAAKISGIGSK